MNTIFVSSRRKYAIVALTFLSLLCLTGIWLLGSYLTSRKYIDPYILPEHAIDVSFESESGSTIKGWLFDSVRPTAKILLLHGKDASRVAMHERAKRFHSMGFAVLAIDFQAHGQSEGDRITLGYLESLDVSSSIDYLEERFHNIPLIALGVSLGGAALLLSDSTEKPDLLILESVFPDISSAVKNRLNAIIPHAGLLTPLLTLQLRLRLGKPTSWFSPLNASRTVAQPTLILSGANDDRTTPQETQRIYQSLAGPKELVLMEGIGHDDLELLGQERYWTVVESFISKYL